MNNLNENQKNKLLALAEIADKGDLAVVTKMFEMQDTFEQSLEEVTQIKEDILKEKQTVLNEVTAVKEVARNIPPPPKDGENGQDGRDGKDGKDGKDGRDGSDGLDGRNGRDGVDGKEGPVGKDGSPDTPDQVIEKINRSKGLISRERIEGLTDAIRNMVANATAVGITTTNFFLNNTLVGRAKNINFTGSGVSSVTVTGDQANVAITGGGGTGSITVEVPTGTVNGVNTTFTTANTPKWISVDGTNKFSPDNYTYAGNTITIVDGAPPTLEIHNFY